MIDFLLGCWLSIQHEAILSFGYLAQIPALGMGALLWGFLPSARKEGVGDWVAQQLARGALLRVAFLAAVALGTLSLFRSSVVVSAVAPDASTTVALVDGQQARPDSTAIAHAAHLRLNRLTTPVRHGLWILPWGRRIWLETPTAVSSRDQRVVPWIPTKLQYPDDFALLAAIAVLPSPASLPKLHGGTYWITLVAGEAAGDTLARGRLGEHGTLVSYTVPPILFDDVRARWRTRFAPTNSDTEDVTALVNLWASGWDESNRLRAVRPIQVGESVTWMIRSGDRVARQGKLQLDAPITDLYVAL